MHVLFACEKKCVWCCDFIPTLKEFYPSGLLVWWINCGTVRNGRKKELIRRVANQRATRTINIPILRKLLAVTWRLCTCLGCSDVGSSSQLQSQSNVPFGRFENICEKCLGYKVEQNKENFFN